MLSLSWIISVRQLAHAQLVADAGLQDAAAVGPVSGRIVSRRSGSSRPASSSASTSTRIGSLNRLAAGNARSASTLAVAPLCRSTTSAPRLPCAAEPSPRLEARLQVSVGVRGGAGMSRRWRAREDQSRDELAQRGRAQADRNRAPAPAAPAASASRAVCEPGAARRAGALAPGARRRTRVARAAAG